jgi:hypothetical protein
MRLVRSPRGRSQLVIHVPMLSSFTNNTLGRLATEWQSSYGRRKKSTRRVGLRTLLKSRLDKMYVAGVTFMLSCAGGCKKANRRLRPR